MKENPIRQARGSDLLAIQRLLSTYFLDMEELKPEDFWVYEIGDKIVGCAALVKSGSHAQKNQTGNQKFVEIHSIAVHPNFKGKKIGTDLINYLLENNKLESKKLGSKKNYEDYGSSVYVRTSCPRFFEKLKFKPIDDSEKLLLWEDCKACDHFKNCTQYAMKYEYGTKNIEKPEYRESTEKYEDIENIEKLEDIERSEHMGKENKQV